MRIGLFSDTYFPYLNGVSTSIKMLRDVLIKKGHEVYIITTNKDRIKVEYDEYNKILRLPGIRLPFYDFRFGNFYNPKAAEYVKSFELDIIHSHTEYSIGAFSRVMAQRLNIPVVHTFHTMYDDYIYYVTKGYFEKSSKMILEYLMMFYCDTTCDELIVPTRKTYNFFKERYKYSRPIHIIPTGIEIERFYLENINKDKVSEIRTKYNLSKDDFVSIFVGRIAQEKNLEYLFQCFETLHLKNPKHKLLIVGGGPSLENYKTKYKKDYIIFTGPCDWEEVPMFYAASDVFVTASLSETQGLTLIEAGAANKPLVCIEDDSFKIIVLDDFNGYFFKDEKEFTAKIELLRKDKKLYSRLSEQSRNNAEGFSSKNYGDRVLQIYTKLLKNHNKNIFKKYIKDIKRSIMER